jgi:hypothetical protein
MNEQEYKKKLQAAYDRVTNAEAGGEEGDKACADLLKLIFDQKAERGELIDICGIYPEALEGGTE